MSITRNLFGGAITAVTPSNLIDASNLRQVPDSQEVLLDPGSTISIIVEILQKVEPVDFCEAARFHYDSLAHDNSASNTQIHSVLTIPNGRGDTTPSATVLTGTQYVSKFNRYTHDEVRILLALYRVESKNVDLVVTMNVPVMSEEGESVGEQGWDEAKEVFGELVRSLKIVDLDLFV